MSIKKLKKSYDVIDVFPSVNDFIHYLMQNNKLLRNDNAQIKNLYYRVYEDLKKTDISYSLISNWFQKKYKFKHSKWADINFFIERGWTETDAIEEIQKRNDEIKKRNRLCVKYWINKGFSEDESKIKISEQQKNSSKQVKNRVSNNSKKALLDKGYSKDDVDEYMKSKSRYSIKYWKKRGYDEETAKEKISEIQKNNSKQLLQHRKKDPIKYSNIIPTQLGYWVNKGFSNHEAKLKLSERQKTFSKEKCVENYGDEDGIKIFTERQKKWSKSLNENGNMKIGYSKISQELFYILLDYYDTKDKEYIYFATHNKEYKTNKTNGGIWLYDFTDLKNKKIIEYHGDDYHGNPKKYLAEDTPHPFNKKITAKEMWKKDEDKMNTAKENGFEIFVVWDSEYRWGDKNSVLENCLSFLNKKSYL